MYRIKGNTSLEDADFSIYRVKKLIAEGEKDAEHILARKKENDIRYYEFFASALSYVN
jgi:hypothetical protein